MNQRSEMVTFKLDGTEIHAAPGETILQAAQRYGTDIPHLCYKPGYRADGNCRACMVEIKGRAGAGAFVLPRPEGRNGSRIEERAGGCSAEDDSGTAAFRHARAEVFAGFRTRSLGDAI